MFGYIRPFEPQLRICELEEYRAVYCGLCRSLGKRFGPMARMTLSYDFAFYTMLALSVQEEIPSYSKQNCPFAPFKKRLHLNCCPQTEEACDAAVLLLREKCSDNLIDEKSAKRVLWRAASVPIEHAAQKAALAQPDTDHICREMTALQRETEASPAPSVDAACAPTAQTLAFLCSKLSPKPEEQRVLERFGYMLGRFIYLCDAVDDLEKDRRRGAFNPLLSHAKTEYAADTLRMTIAEAGRAYDLLSPRFYKGVLDNIVYLGLQNTADTLLKRRNQNEKSV